MKENQQYPKNPKKNNFSGLEKYAKYSAIAIQMVLIILLFVWGGKKLDQKFNNGENLYIIILSVLGVFIALYMSLKDFIRFKK